MSLDDLNYFDFVSEPFVAAHLSPKYVLMYDKLGFEKKKNEFVFFGIEHFSSYLETAIKIRLMALTDDNVKVLRIRGFKLQPNKTKSPFLHITNTFFDLKGKKFESLRRRINRYKHKNIEIKEKPNSFEEFESFLKRWNELRKHAHYQIYIGYDKNFMANFISKWQDILIPRFFYLDGVLVGYSICEKVKNGCYNLLFHKCDTSLDGFCAYMDYKMFEIIHEAEQGDFVINMGSDSGEKGMYRYKTETFHVDQKIFTLKEATIINK